METYEDSNCQPLSDSFSLYERYMRSFNVLDTFEDIDQPEANERASNSCDTGHDLYCAGNKELKTTPDEVLNKHFDVSGSAFSAENCMSVILDDKSTDYLDQKQLSLCNNSQECGSIDNCFVCEESTDKSEHTDAPISSEDSSSKHPIPVIITSASAMENSNNAVDSVPMFRDRKPSESVFKHPSSELTFNGSLKYIQRLKPLLDPTSALTSNLLTDPHTDYIEPNDNSINSAYLQLNNESNHKSSDSSEQNCDANKLDEGTDSTGDSQYTGLNPGMEVLAPEPNVECKSKGAQDEESSKWTADQSYSSLEASFDSGVRSPDMFSDDDEKPEEIEPEPKDFWHFLKDYDAVDRKSVRKMEETLQGVLPPPSVTIVKTDAAEMLKKYYCFLPAFSEDANINVPELNSTTPTKLTSYVKLPDANLPEVIQETTNDVSLDKPKIEITEKAFCAISREVDKSISVSDDSVVLQMASEAEVKEMAWPEVAKCRFYDVHYNLTKFSERLELLALRCGERYVGAETDTSVTVYSGSQQSPSSANKRKALRLKMAAAKSPGRRLSHLARRRQAFCSAATIGEKALASNSKLVLIDKNFFPHRKLINTDRRRTPGKKTPTRKTPGKKTPAKTPNPRSGSSKKKAMRRLLMDPDTLTRSQPTRETSKRALFISPENRKPMPQPISVPLRAMKSKRALFGSPVRPAETKSLDGYTDMFLKRKREALEETAEYGIRSKIAKSLSFGGEGAAGAGGAGMSRRASEMVARPGMAELDEHHRKKLLWAVSEALRVHGWRMQSPGFREKASSLARLTRRLLTLAPHAARLASPTLSSSETMLKIARQYVFAVIQGRSVEDCFREEQARLADDADKLGASGYVSAAHHQQLKSRATHTGTSQIKENTCDGIKQEQQRSGSKNILQDKLLNIDTHSNSSSSGFSMLDKPALYKSNSMPSFEEAAKMRARRQISFDNVDFPKR